ncbi:MAG: hypothetical protein ACXWI8_13610 [Burkholderiales bacterium]
MHRFRDTAATRWLRAGIDVRTVQVWLGHPRSPGSSPLQSVSWGQSPTVGN